LSKVCVCLSKSAPMSSKVQLFSDYDEWNDADPQGSSALVAGASPWALRQKWKPPAAESFIGVDRSDDVDCSESAIYDGLTRRCFRDSNHRIRQTDGWRVPHFGQVQIRLPRPHSFAILGSLIVCVTHFTLRHPGITVDSPALFSPEEVRWPSFRAAGRWRHQTVYLEENMFSEKFRMIIRPRIEHGSKQIRRRQSGRSLLDEGPMQRATARSGLAPASLFVWSCSEGVNGQLVLWPKFRLLKVLNPDCPNNQLNDRLRLKK
jgi:hypothetical protein